MRPPLRFLYCVAFGLIVMQPSPAADWVVTTTADNLAPGSLRSRINAAANGDVIQIPTTLGTSITLTLGELPITKSIEIQGPNASTFSIMNFTGRVFHFREDVMGQVTAKVSGIQITGKVTGASGINGVAGAPNGTPGASAEGGGALVAVGCLVTISHCIFNGCQVIAGNGGHAYYDPEPGKSLSAWGGSGRDACGGAVMNNEGDLIIESCTFMNNFAIAGNGGDGFKGGQGGVAGDALGGAICTGYGVSALKVVNSTFHANSGCAGYGGAGGDAELLSPGVQNGGNGVSGGDAKGGAIFMNRGSPDDTVDGFLHDTIVANGLFPGQGGKGGSGKNGGANGTGYTNGVGWGGGLSRSTPPSGFPPVGGYVPVRNTIMADNFVAWRFTANGLFIAKGPDVFGSISSKGYSFFGVRDVYADGFDPLDQTGTLTMPIYPILGPLQLNGGQTPTLAPLACSPVIDRGSMTMLGMDQTGQVRPRLVTSGPFPSDGSDIGSVELQSYPEEAAPILNIEKVANTVVLTWPANACYILEQSMTLQNDWINAPPSTVVGSTRRLVIFPLGDRMFFRLRRP